jgi:ribosomal protein L3
VLGCTAYTDGNTKVEGKAIGMAHVMTKPFKRRHYIQSLVQIGLLPPNTIAEVEPLVVNDLLGSPKTNKGRSYNSVFTPKSQNHSNQDNPLPHVGLDSKLSSLAGSPSIKNRKENGKVIEDRIASIQEEKEREKPTLKGFI